jgi:hypothetical protein
MSYFERDITLTVKLHAAEADSDAEVAARITEFLTTALAAGLNMPALSHAGESVRQIRVNGRPYRVTPAVAPGGVRVGLQEIFGA